MVLIFDHIIIINIVDFIVYIYNTLDKIHEALAANWICTCVMVKNDLNPPQVDQWSSNSAQTITNQDVNTSEVCWVFNESQKSVGEKIEVNGMLQVAINSHGRAKMDQKHHQIPLVKPISPKSRMYLPKELNEVHICWVD